MLCKEVTRKDLILYRTTTGPPGREKGPVARG
jgi:hypothetical protein